MLIPKLAIWKGFPFRYRDVHRSSEAELEIIRYQGGPFWSVVENSRGPSSIRVQAVFLGPLAATEKAAFNIIASLPGPGTLIHPDLGIITGYLKSWPESSAGQVRDLYSIDLEFLPLIDLPGAEIAFAAAVNAAGLTMIAAAAAGFTGAKPEEGNAIDLQAVTTSNASSARALTPLADMVTATKRDALTMALESASTADADGTIAAWDLVATQIDTQEAAEAGLDAIMSDWQAAIDMQATAYTQGLASAAVYEYIACRMATALANLAIGATWETYDDEAAAASRLYDSLGAVLLMASDAGVVSAMIDLRAKLYAGMITDGLKLPKRTTFETRSIMSSAELAYYLYGDIDRADEIESDNDVTHPTFLGAGTYRILRGA